MTLSVCVTFLTDQSGTRRLSPNPCPSLHLHLTKDVPVASSLLFVSKLVVPFCASGFCLVCAEIHYRYKDNEE